MSSWARPFLLLSEAVLLSVVVAIGDTMRRTFYCPINWHLVLVEFGFWFAAVLVLVPVTYWAEERSGLRVWHWVAMLLAALATWPLQVVFLPPNPDFGNGLVFKLGMFLIVSMPIGWALALESTPKTGERPPPS